MQTLRGQEGHPSGAIFGEDENPCQWRLSGHLSSYGDYKAHSYAACKLNILFDDDNFLKNCASFMKCVNLLPRISCYLCKLHL